MAAPHWGPDAPWEPSRGPGRLPACVLCSDRSRCALADRDGCDPCRRTPAPRPSRSPVPRLNHLAVLPLGPPSASCGARPPRSQGLWRFPPCWRQRWAALVAAPARPRVGAAAMTPREAVVIRREPAAVLRERTTLLATQPLARPAPPIASWRRSCALALRQLAE